MMRPQRSPKLLACCAVALLLALRTVGHPVAVAYFWPPASAARTVAPPDASPARMLAAADVRSGPGERYLVLAVAWAGEEHTILGRSSDGLWWRIDYGGLPAWVAAAQVETLATGVPVVRVGGQRL